MKQIPLNLALDTPPRLDGFVVGDNTLALATGLARYPDVRLAQPWLEALAWAGPLLTLLSILLLAALYRRALRPDLA